MNDQAKTRVTIDQVAKLCGVSKTTISRYLNGKYENMSADTRESIRRVIEELDYRPNRSAQRLKASRSMLVGCVIGDVGSPFSALLLKGITQVCEQAGYQVLFADSGEDPDRERRAIQGFLEDRVDGLIVNTSGNNEYYLQELEDSGVPLVLADRPLLGERRIDCVTVDSRRAAYDCVKFLLGQGYEQVAFFSETIGHISPRILRRQGYEQAVRELGKAGSEPEIYEFYQEDMESVLRCMSLFRRRHPHCRIAALCSNGASAQKLLVGFKELGIEPGYDFGLCTFDNWDWLQIASVGISAVETPTKEVGAKAAELLLEKIGGKREARSAPVELELPYEIIARQSAPGGKE